MQLEAAGLKALDARPVLDQEMQLLQRAAGGGGQEQQQHSSQALADERSSSSARLREQQRQAQEQQAAMQAAMAARLADIAGQLSLGSSRDKEAIRQQVGWVEGPGSLWLPALVCAVSTPGCDVLSAASSP
jgi:hypothetical protein